MHRLAPQEWVPVFERLRHVDALALVEAAGRGEKHDDERAGLALTLETARTLWTAQAMQRAWLVTVLGGHGGGQALLRVDSIPTPTGYVLRCGDFEIHTSRRTYVHEFPAFCAVAAPHAHRADSFLAFPPDVARTLPIPSTEDTGVVVWADTRLETTHPAPETIQLHARFFVNFRTGPPRRQRGRRARRWTKVDPGARSS